MPDQPVARKRFILHAPYCYREVLMPSTKAFRIGDTQAVTIPAELAWESIDMELEIERVGDELRIRPARASLNGVMKKFARFSPDFLAAGRPEQEQARPDES
jgi:antitoxin VapB